MGTEGDGLRRREIGLNEQGGARQDGRRCCSITGAVRPEVERAWRGEVNEWWLGRV